MIMLRRALAAAVLAAAAAAALAPAPATAAPADNPPACQHAVITENSGNGPTYRVVICTALRAHAPGDKWQLVVDGGRLANGAVILGYQIPATTGKEQHAH